MNPFRLLIASLLIITLPACKEKRVTGTRPAFAKEMVKFEPFENNPVFSGTLDDTWDRQIRERGFILLDEGIYKMWYTGYKGANSDIKYLGYATSSNGISWSRHEGNPIFSQKWTEDMFVLKYEGKYYMFAEGENDIAHLLISENGINWQEIGDLTLLTVKGDTIPGPYGTPAVWVENGKWHLFYERMDEAIWLASSVDLLTWTNVREEPVLEKGPGSYDSGAVAVNQIVKHKGNYYMYYHGTSDSGWNNPGVKAIWTSNVAISPDLIQWVKYDGNPIVEGDHSSPILVPEGKIYRLYTMHKDVWLYLPG